MDFNNSELAALQYCDNPKGVSTEGFIPAKDRLQSLLDRGLVEIVRSEIVGGWRQYEWFRTTARGRTFYEVNAAPVGEW